MLCYFPRAGHSHAQSSLSTLNGAYGFYRTGTTSVGPLAAVGLITFDGTGAHSPARQTIRKNGLTTRDLFADPAVDGPYEVDPDCAGRFLNFDGSVAGHFVVVDGGKEIFAISLTARQQRHRSVQED